MMRFWVAMLLAMLAFTCVDAHSFILYDGPAQVIFSATSDQMANISKSEVIKYNKVFTNVGDGYDPATGIFVCPEEGIYWLSLFAIGNPWIGLSLIKNSEQLVSIWSASGAKNFVGGGNGIFVHLTQGDKVFVVSSVEFLCYGSQNDTFATFSGYKLPFP